MREIFGRGMGLGFRLRLRVAVGRGGENGSAREFSLGREVLVKRRSEGERMC